MCARLGALKMAFNQPKFSSYYSRTHLLSKINMSPILDTTYWPRWSVSFPSEQKVAMQVLAACDRQFHNLPRVLRSKQLKIAPQLSH